MSNRILQWIGKNKWQVAGLVIAALNPLSGVMLGIVMLTDEKLTKIGKIVLVVSVILLIVTFLIFIFSQKR